MDLNKWYNDTVILPQDWQMRNIDQLNSIQQPNEIVIHHVGSGETPNLPILDNISEEEAVKNIEHHHIRNLNFLAFGYQYAVMLKNIFAARPINRVGAHVRGQNTGKIGILVYGNFNYEEPTQNQKLMITNLVNFLKQIKPFTVTTHGRLANTMCPGKHLQEFVDEMNEANWSQSNLKKQKVNKNAMIERIKSATSTLQELSDLIKRL